MIKPITHVMATESECSQNLVNALSAYDLMLDIKALVSEHYIATFSPDGDSLNIAFNNGQKFCITVKEIK